MRITKIEEGNLQENLSELITLGDEFLHRIGSPATERKQEEKRIILQEMARNAPTTAVLLARCAEQKAIGLSYYHFGWGYACGGPYLWLNCIYIRDAYQRRGYGTRLLRYVEDDGRRRGITLFLCCRNVSNEGSRRLFEHSSFQQDDQILMEKTYGGEA